MRDATCPTEGCPRPLYHRTKCGQRTCSRCGSTPDEVAFRRDKRAWDGLGGYCKPCEKRYNADYQSANREANNAKRNAQYHANRERYLAQQKAYRKANIEVIRQKDRIRARGNPVSIERSRRWRIANRERYLSNMRRWYHANSDAHREYGRRWSAANRDRVREMSANTAARRAAQKRNAAGKIEYINRRAIWRRDKGICGLCATPVPFRDMHLDHHVPLSKGGEHTESNVHATHSRCNLSKGNREVPRWGLAQVVVPVPRAATPDGVLTLF